VAPPRDAPSDRRWLGALFVVLAALVVRTLYFIQFARSPLLVRLGPDDLYYLNWAKRIAAGDWLGNQVFEQGPLYPYLLGALFSRLGEVAGVVYLLQLLSGVLMCLLIFDTGRRLFDLHGGIAAGLLAALYGPFVFYECMVMKSFLSPLLTAVMLWAAIRDRDVRQLRGLCLAGIAVGLAALVQENHILLLAPLAVWIWQQSPGESAWPKRAVRVATVLAAAALCIAPVTWRNWVVGHELVLVTAGGGEVFYMAHGPQARPFYNPPDFVVAAPGEEHEDFRREARRRTGQDMTRGEASRYWFGEGLRAIAADPLRSLKLTAQKAAVLFGDYDVPDSQSYAATREFVTILKWLPSFGWIGGLAVVGMFLSLASWRRHWLPLGVVAAFTLSILLTYNFGRMRLGMMPAMLLLAGYAAVWIGRALARAELRWRGCAAALAACIVSLAMFYPLLAGDFELSDRKSIARLAMMSGQYDLAERHLRAIEQTLDKLGAAESGSDQYLYQVAEVHQMLGQLYSRTGRTNEAVEQFRRVRQLPLRDQYREGLLLENLGAMQQLAESAVDTAALKPTSLTKELALTAEQLRLLRPERIEYWALSAIYLDEAQERAAIAEGLEQSWKGISQPSAEQQGWYWLGRAALADAAGDEQAAAAAAKRASERWPQSPFQRRLEQWRQSR
jgi:4-amino-4-deoxy-L-arabinose transferase-like glycosyltransferase